MSAAKSNTDESPAIKSSEHAEKPIGLGRLSQRVRRRTLDLVAIGIAAIGLLTVGNQLAEWWSVETPTGAGTPMGPPATPVFLDFAQSNEPLLLSFGKMPTTILRQEITGTPDSAQESLRNECRRILNSTDYPRFDAEPAEIRLLDQLDGISPIDEHPGGGQLFQIEHPLAMVIGVKQKTGETGRTLDARVICCGMACPSGNEKWTLYILQPAAADTPIPEWGMASPLPDKCQTVVSIANRQGGHFSVFRWDGKTADGVNAFRTWFTEQGWEVHSNDRVGTEAYVLECRDNRQEPHGSAYLQIHENPQSSPTGIIHIYSSN